MLAFVPLLALALSAQAPTIDSIQARKLMRQPVLSVMSKSQSGPSGDKHDYVSFAPDPWHDPGNQDGPPNIREDGHVNHELVTEGDSENFSATVRTIRQLTEAFVAHAEPEFADNAVRRIVVWFLAPATRMNPNLNYGQVVKGHNAGRPEGIIAMRELIDILDSIRDLDRRKAWPPAEDKAMREWMTAYYEWLTTSELGVRQSQAKNNHGSWYAAQAMRIEVYLGMKSRAKRRAEELKERIAWQIEPDGSQPLEAARADSFRESVFNLEALAMAAAIAKPLGIDLWKYRTKDGRGMDTAFRYLLPFASGRQRWPGRQGGSSAEPASLSRVRELYESRLR